MNFIPLPHLPPLLDALLKKAPLNDLGPGKPMVHAAPVLKAMSLETLFMGRNLLDPNMGQCCLAALWLRFDFLKESHALSMEIETHTGRYWHAIMHRREPDAANASHWFERAGSHAIHPQLIDMTRNLHDRLRQNELCTVPAKIPILNTISAHERWHADVFTNFCEEYRGSKSAMEIVGQTIQQIEWELLFRHSYLAATESLSTLDAAV